MKPVHGRFSRHVGKLLRENYQHRANSKRKERTTMRKLIVLSFITVDGVIQAPGAPLEDTSGGFPYGGWQAPYLDEFLLKTCPITLGTGKRLFAEGTIPAAFKVSKCQVSPTGVIVANLERAGEVATGTVGE